MARFTFDKFRANTRGNFTIVPVGAYEDGRHVGVSCKHCANVATVVVMWGPCSMALCGDCSG